MSSGAPSSEAPAGGEAVVALSVDELPAWSRGGSPGAAVEHLTLRAPRRGGGTLDVSLLAGCELSSLRASTRS